VQLRDVRQRDLATWFPGKLAAMGVSFFEMFFDSDYRQRSDINDARDEAAEVREVALTNIAQLHRIVATQRDQIRDLSVAVSVLVKMLAEQGVLDDKVLRYRVEAEVEERIEAAKRPAPVTDEDTQLRPMTCTRCQQTRAPSQTIMTADGAVCDPSCAAFQ